MLPLSLARRYAKLKADELVRVCADRGNMQAWDEFLRRFDPLVASTVWRVACRYTRPTPELCDDLAQTVYLKLNEREARLLRDFVPTHEDASFSFLKVVTANVVHDHFKSKSGRDADPLPPDIAAPADHDDGILFREIDEFLQGAVRAVDRRIFWFYYRQGMSAREIAAVPGIGIGVDGVESVLKRVRDLVRRRFSGERKTRETAAGKEVS